MTFENALLAYLFFQVGVAIVLVVERIRHHPSNGEYQKWETFFRELKSPARSRGGRKRIRRVRRDRVRAARSKA